MPNENTWPGVSELKACRPSIPTGIENILEKSIKNINNMGLNLLQVHCYIKLLIRF